MAAIERHAPDVAFLDIRMPGMSGLDVARQIGARAHVVFVTAFDEHAIAAFESGAVDYVLKPLEAARLATTITRLKQRMSSAPPDLGRLLSRLSQAPAKGPLNWVQASAGNKLRLITVDEIVCFQADSKYTRVLMRDSEAVISKPIKELARGARSRRSSGRSTAARSSTSAASTSCSGTKTGAWTWRSRVAPSGSR